jgi:hypothetical protein
MFNLNALFLTKYNFKPRQKYILVVQSPTAPSVSSLSLNRVIYLVTRGKLTCGNFYKLITNPYLNSL